MGWPNNYVQGVYNSNNELIAVQDGAGGQIGLAATYTWATKPLASAYIGAAFISDIGGGTYWVSNGVKWSPLNGSCSIFSSNTTYTITPANVAGALVSTDILLSIPVAEGMFNNEDIFEFSSDVTRVNNSAIIGQKLYLSSSAGTLGTLLGFDYSHANYRSYSVAKFKRITSTSIVLLGGLGGVEVTGGSSVPRASLTTTVPNMDNDFFIQVVPYYTTSSTSISYDAMRFSLRTT